MSHPDPAAHLMQRGWSVHVDSDRIPIWSQQRDGWVLDVSLVNGRLHFFVAHAFDIDALDMYALSILAAQQVQQ